SRGIGVRQLELRERHTILDHGAGIGHDIPVENKLNFLPT
ncbi:putative signal peptidase complex subunit 3, partial [Dichanthelium oligosanthes]